MRHIVAVFKKQVKDTRKNPVLLLQFLLYPLMVLILNNSMSAEEMPPNFFTEMFGVMFTGMAPLITTATVVAEEKEKGTLRTLLMSGVHPFAYLAGIGLFIFSACTLGAAAMVLQGGYSLREGALFLFLLCIGCLISEILGAVIGMARSSQVSATGTAVPVMSVLAFLPMLSMFNEKIEKAAGFIYTYRIKNLISGLSYGTMEITDWAVIAGSFVLAVALFALFYKRNGLD